MKLSISERYRPFSHTPGVLCLIPGTSYYVQVFPASLRLFDLDKKLIKEIKWEVEGPLTDFTVFQDLEKGVVTVKSREMSYHILPSLEITNQKHPPRFSLSKERLFLGVTKQLEWEKIKRRGELREIFPLWFALGNPIDLPLLQKRIGIFSLLDACESAIKKNRPETILEPFYTLFLAGFSGLFVPRREDEEHQGLPFPTPGLGKENPLYLLSEGARLIKSLFFAEEKEQISLLPHLPPEFFSGRCVDFNCFCGTFSFEWTKKELRQLFLKASKDAELRVDMSLSSFRLKNAKADKGQRMKRGELLEIKSGSLYLLDQFQK